MKKEIDYEKRKRINKITFTVTFAVMIIFAFVYFGLMLSELELFKWYNILSVFVVVSALLGSIAKNKRQNKIDKVQTEILKELKKKQIKTN